MLRFSDIEIKRLTKSKSHSRKQIAATANMIQADVLIVNDDAC